MLDVKFLRRNVYTCFAVYYIVCFECCGFGAAVVKGLGVTYPSSKVAVLLLRCNSHLIFCFGLTLKIPFNIFSCPPSAPLLPAIS